MRLRRLTKLLIAGVVASLLAALYCLGGIIQAASLFTGDRAQRNYEFWGALFIGFSAAFIVCTLALIVVAVRAWLSQRRESAI